MSHTPGPWMAKKTANSQKIEINAPKGDPYLKYGNWEKLAAVYGSDEQPRIGKRVARANAALIAAAPDMLAVLEELEDSVDYWSEYDVPIGIQARIKNAIKKARSEQ